MVYVYTGTGGSGKSLNISRRIKRSLCTHKMHVIANFPINTASFSKSQQKHMAPFTYKKNSDITVRFLVAYSDEYLIPGKEHQCLLVVDEARRKFNPRAYDKKDREEWVEFFTEHRHYGYDIILATQSIRMIDRHIKDCVEYEVRHRKVSNFGFIGLLLKLFRISVFVAIEKWCDINEKTGHEFFRYRKSDSKLYDTMMLFSEDRYGKRIGKTADAVPAPCGDTAACGGGAPQEVGAVEDGENSEAS